MVFFFIKFNKTDKSLGRLISKIIDKKQNLIIWRLKRGTKIIGSIDVKKVVCGYDKQFLNFKIR